METHETYVSLETAKLLKRAGFDWECSHIYYCYKEDNNTWQLEPNCKNNDRISQLDYVLRAPALSVAQKWLREVKRCCIFCTPTTRTKWCFTLMCPDTRILEHAKDYKTYEEALEYGIQKCLTDLLKGK